jgi:hypothetical protein
MTTINTCQRDFADKSFLASRDVRHEETPVQKVGAVIGLLLFIGAMGLMMVAGPETLSALQSVVQ